MSRKDYEAIAAALKLAREDYAHDGAAERFTIDMVARRIAFALAASDNPRFDLDKFLTACGL